MGPSRLYVDSTGFGLNPWKHLENPREFFDFFQFFPGFVRPRFGENIRADLFVEKVCCFIVVPVFCYQDSFLATQDPSQTKDLSILIYSVVLIY